jgi:hypothetical protein
VSQWQVAVLYRCGQQVLYSAERPLQGTSFSLSQLEAAAAEGRAVLAAMHPDATFPDEPELLAMDPGRFVMQVCCTVIMPIEPDVG